MAYARHNLSCVSAAHQQCEGISIELSSQEQAEQKRTCSGQKRCGGDADKGWDGERPAGYVGYCQSMNYLAAQLLLVLGVR
jgi:hypothetical protein